MNIINSVEPNRSVSCKGNFFRKIFNNGAKKFERTPTKDTFVQKITSNTNSLCEENRKLGREIENLTDYIYGDNFTERIDDVLVKIEKLEDGKIKDFINEVITFTKKHEKEVYCSDNFASGPCMEEEGEDMLLTCKFLLLKEYMSDPKISAEIEQRMLNARKYMQELIKNNNQ